MRGDRSRKKARLINDIPPVQNGVVSASNTPTISEGRLANILPNEVNDMNVFFDDDQIQIPEYDIASSLKTTLRSSWTSEESLRNAVYTDLMDNHGIAFPESSLSAPSEASHLDKSTGWFACCSSMGWTANICLSCVSSSASATAVAAFSGVSATFTGFAAFLTNSVETKKRFDSIDEQFDEQFVETNKRFDNIEKGLNLLLQKNYLPTIKPHTQGAAAASAGGGLV